MRWARILTVIIGSVWFFPVSCTAGLFAGISLIAELDARDVSKGEPVHPHFSVVSQSRGNGESFVVTKLNDIRRYEELLPADATNSTSYLMPTRFGQMIGDTSDYAYKVIEETSSGQIIEVIERYHDGDNTIWSRYKATRSTISPISSRMFYFGYMFAVFPYVLMFSLLLYGVGWYLKRRMYKSKSENDDT